jgi:hypothetical protein
MVFYFNSRHVNNTADAVAILCMLQSEGIPVINRHTNMHIMETFIDFCELSMMGHIFINPDFSSQII